MENKFEVGTYVWFIDPDNPRVMHYLVTEEIVKNSVNGSTREYVFESSNGRGKTAAVSSKALKGVFFSERSEVYDFMLSQAAEAINSMLDRACRNKEQSKHLEELEPKVVEESTSEDSEDLIVELPDGTKARLKGGFPNET
ncbi:MAG: hypothetical protein CBB97_07120 [Candidatus Endolissoclinum sp. TMED37]|nr:MAG: hypothetical protein CBB97_07120 [Candidatus Endolissoclinum sp. TMED37]